MTAQRAMLGSLKRSYALWLVLMPLAVFALVFASLCAWECTAAPWFSFLAAPVIAVVGGSALLLIYWKRAGQLAGDEPTALRRFLLWSLLWGPVAAVAAFYAAVWLLSVASLSAAR